MCDLMEDMKRTRRGQPQLPSELPPALMSFQQLQPANSNIWRHVGFADVYNYLRRNKKLQIPPQWRDVVPTRMHEVQGDI